MAAGGACGGVGGRARACAGVRGSDYESGAIRIVVVVSVMMFTTIVSSKSCRVRLKPPRKPPVVIIHIFGKCFEVHGADKKENEGTTERVDPNTTTKQTLSGCPRWNILRFP